MLIDCSYVIIEKQYLNHLIKRFMDGFSINMFSYQQNKIVFQKVFTQSKQIRQDGLNIINSCKIVLIMLAEIDQKIQCTICYDIMLTPAQLNCSHQFCLYCIRSIMYKEKQQAVCPFCRKKMNFPIIDKKRQIQIIEHIRKNNKDIKVYQTQANTINHFDKNLTVSQPFYFLLKGEILHGDVIWGNGSVHSSYKGEVGRASGKVKIQEDGSIQLVDFRCHYSNSPYQLWIWVLKCKGLSSYLPGSFYEYEAVDSIYQWQGWGRHSSGILNIKMKYLESQVLKNEQ